MVENVVFPCENNKSGNERKLLFLRNLYSYHSSLYDARRLIKR